MAASVKGRAMSQSPNQFHCKVTDVTHWTKDGLFSFKTERPQSFIFEPGQFVMIGLPDEHGKPIMRAYSVASPSWDDHLEFLSIKVENGPLTSRLQKIKPGDEILMGNKPTGTLVHSALLPGKNLFLMGTGTGLAPWMSLIRDPETYKKFEHVYVCHGVRHADELAFRDYLEKGIHDDAMVNMAMEHADIEGGLNGRLIYYPSATREALHEGKGFDERLTTQAESGELFQRLGLAQTQFDPKTDRIMVCGSVPFNEGMEAICESLGMEEGATNKPGAFVVERAFVEKVAKPEAKVAAAGASLAQSAKAGPNRQ